MLLPPLFKDCAPDGFRGALCKPETYEPGGGAPRPRKLINQSIIVWTREADPAVRAELVEA